MISNAGLPRPSLTAGKKKEIRETLDFNERTRYQAQDRAGGLLVEEDTRGGGCMENPETIYTLRNEQTDEIVASYDFVREFRHCNGLSVSPDGTQILGEFYAKEGGRELVEIPLDTKGFFRRPIDFLRRKKILPKKRIFKTADDIDHFDIGPKKRVAISSEDTLYLHTPKGGLEKRAQFSTQINTVEYLEDGQLLVSAGSTDWPEFYLFDQDGRSPKFLPQGGFDPEANEARLSRLSNRSRGASASQDNKLVALVRDNEELVLYHRQSGEVEELGLNQHPDRPGTVFSGSRGEYKAQWSADSRFFLQPASETNKDGQTRDFMVVDLESKEKHLIPSTREFKVVGNTVSFQAVTGEAVQLDLTELESMKQQAWYSPAILGSAPSTEDVGEIKIDEQGILVGEVFLANQDV